MARLWTTLFVMLFFLHGVQLYVPIISDILQLFSLGTESMICKYYHKECCTSPWVHANISGLRRVLDENLHGQHMVSDTVRRYLAGHFNNADPDKALVISFHGPTGVGKNFVSRYIAEHLFTFGLQSQYVHLYVSTLKYPHSSRVDIYKEELKKEITNAISCCPRSLFIFDEMDKMPMGLIDALKPFLDHYPHVNGVDCRKATFIFLSNTAGLDIAEATLRHFSNGGKREDLLRPDMERVITESAFNSQGGLWHSSLIKHHLITAFVPFLPLDRSHVKQCARNELKRRDIEPNEHLLEQVADELAYTTYHNRRFSASGCKRVNEKVDLVLED